MNMPTSFSFRVILLLSANLFSTVTFAVFFSSLELYLTHRAIASEGSAASLMGVFLALNYTFSLVGGYIGGRLMSYRLLFLIGTVLQIVACSLLLVPSLIHHHVFSILGIFLVGCGASTPCISMVLTQYFKNDNVAREKVFMWNYAYMNIGFTIGFLLSALYQQTDQFHDMFVCSLLANILATVLFLLGWASFRDVSTPLCTWLKARPAQWRFYARLCLALFVLGVCWWLADFFMIEATKVQLLLITLASITFMYFIYAALSNRENAEGRKVFAFIILAVSNVVFWSIYQLMPTGMVFFITHDVNRHIGDYLVSPQYFNLINSIVVVVGGLFLPMLFKKIRQKRTYDVPLQFASALFLMGGGLLILLLAVKLNQNVLGVSMIWVALSYMIQSLAEVLIAPIGRSMIGQLASERFAGIMMGTWMMLSGLSAVIAGKISSMTAMTSNGSLASSNEHFCTLFLVLGLIAMAAALVIFVLKGFLRSLIGA